MQQQLELGAMTSPRAARATGDVMAAACTDKAKRVAEFDFEGACKFVLGWLTRHGATPGEELVNNAIAHGHRVHDARAFGSVFRVLSVRKQIRCIGYCERQKGHGTAGGRIWKIAVALEVVAGDAHG
jgi:hypothetical protein